MNLQDTIIDTSDYLLSEINHVINAKSAEFIGGHPKILEHREDVEYQIIGNYFEPKGQMHRFFLCGEIVAGFTVWAEFNGFELLIKLADVETEEEQT